MFSMIKFGMLFEFETEETMLEASFLADECETYQEFVSYLKSEGVSFLAIFLKTSENNESLGYYQMSLL